MKTLALLAFALLAAPQGEMPLRRTLTAGNVDTYKIEDKVQQTVKMPGGETPMKIATTKTYALKTVAVDAAAGTATIEATTTFDKIEMDGPAAGMMGDKPQPVTQKGKIDVRNRITYEKTPGGDSLQSLLSGTQNAAASETFVELPEKPVKIGDKWEMVVEKNPLVFDQDQKLIATLTGEREVDGVAVWVVSVKGLLKTSVDSSKLPNAKGIDSPAGRTNIRVKGEIDLTSEGLVEKKTGRTISMITKGASKTTLELVETGITLETSGQLDSTVTLQKP